MATYDTRLVRHELLKECTTGIFAGLGLPKDDAVVVADTLIQADLRGVRSHGVMRVVNYVRGIREGNINPKPSIKVVTDLGPTATVDGDRGMGQVVHYRGTKLAIQKAKEHGVGAVTVRNSRHSGAMAYYAMTCLEADCIGFAATNAGINMAPTGGTKRLVGNNPFAVAVPAGQPWPMVLDMATSVAAGGKLDMAIIRGQKIPLDWAMDPEGKPTDDPNVARKGSLLPVGGPKGYGMAVMLDVLCGVLSGGRFGAMLGMPGFGHFILALRVDAFMPLQEFQERMRAVIQQLHECPLAPGADRIYVAGEIEHNLTQERLKSGIPIETFILEQLDEFAAELGVACRPSAWK